MRFASNPEAVRLLEARPEAFNRGLVRALAASVSALEADVLKFVKSTLVDPLSIKAHVRERSSGALILTDHDRFRVYEGTALESAGPAFPRSAILALGALALVLRRLKRSPWRFRPKAARAELLVQAAHFGEDEGVRREFLSEDYVFDPKRVALLITEMWRPVSPKAYRARMARAGIQVLDVRDFSIGPALALRLVEAAVGLWRRCSLEARSWEDVGLALRFLKARLDEEVTLANCEHRAILCLDDYGPGHIVRTLVYRQRAKRTFGIQHSAGNGLFSVPQLAYVCFDRYLIFGRFYRELFHPFWEDLPLVEFGYNRIDGYLRQRPARRRRDKPTILVTLPTISSLAEFREMFPRGEAVLEFLAGVDDRLAERARVIVRPKYSTGIDEVRARIANHRIEFAMGKGKTTTELLDEADLVVASHGSGILVECALLRVPVINHDYVGLIQRYWTKYGADMCSTTAEELRRRVENFASGKALDVDWKRLWADLSYPNDGHTNRVLETLLDGHALGRERQPA